MKKFPEAPEKLRTRTIRQYFKDVETWFADRIPNRDGFVALSKLIDSSTGGNSDFSKCVRGRKDWLFLGNDYARTLDVLQGKWKASDGFLDKQVSFYKEVDSLAREFGAEFHMLVGPNKSSVYPEFLPPMIFPAKERAISILTKKLSEAGISVFDPTELLRASKNKGILYWRTDTHWNELGVKVVLEEWMKRIGQPDLPKVELHVQGVRRGDLVDIGGYFSMPLTEGDSFSMRFLEKKKCDKSLFVIGDSFSIMPQNFFMEMYSNSERCHSGELYKQGIGWLRKKLESLKRKPDLIFMINVERSLVLL